MPEYSYIAVTKDGQKKKGKLEAQDKEKASSLLKADGLIPVKINKSGALTKDLSFSFNKKVTPKELAVFCRQIGSILEAGVTIVESLDMLAEQMENKTFATAIYDTKAEVEKGDTLAVAMKAHSEVFPMLLVNMVEAGEASGNLERSFLRMAVHFEKSAKLKAMVTKAMIYPVMLLCVALVAVIVMSVAVVPKFAKMFEGLGAELPFLTRMVMGFSNFMLKKWYIVLAVAGAIGAGYYFFAKSDKGKHLLATLAIKLPIFGKFTVKNASASLARTLGTLISSGLPLASGLEITARSMGNLLFREALEAAKKEIEQGSPLWEPIKKCGIFPSMICQMIKIGEESGNLEGMLDKSAEYYEEEVEQASQNLTAMMEPMIIVVMGGIVAVLVLAMYLPMIQMYGSM